MIYRRASFTAVALVSIVVFSLAGPLWSQDNVSKKAAPVESIPYSSLDEAIKALRSNPDVTFRSEKDWTIAEDKKAAVAWLLTPVGHPAYPSIVRRSIVNSADGAYMQTDVRCFASQSACDKYFSGNWTNVGLQSGMRWSGH